MMAVRPNREAILALADGRTFRGRAFGTIGEAVGEVVFNTAMTGYQEVLTDPSYRGQMVCMTYPEIGNTGVNREDVESRRVYVEGFIIKECCERPSNWRSELSLHEYLEQAGVVGIEGIDTRALVRHIRTHGAQEAVLSSIDLEPESLIRKAKASPGLIGKDLVAEVTCAEAYDWELSDWELGRGYRAMSKEEMRDAPRVVALDYGIKLNILRRLVASGFRVRVMPAHSTADQILAENPDGVFLSNGPGDPAALPYAHKAVAGVLGKKPVFGICLGHQILGSRWAGRPTSSISAITAPIIRCSTFAPAESRSLRRITDSRSIPSRSRDAPNFLILISTIERWRGCAGRACRSSPCSTIPRLRPGRMIRATFSAASGR